MKYIKLIPSVLVVLSVAFFISACGGGGGGGGGGVISTAGKTSHAVVLCVDGTSQILSGDILKTDVNTTLQFTHHIDSTKYVCVLTGGTAFLWR